MSIKTTRIYTATYDVFCGEQKIDQVINKTVHATNQFDAMLKIKQLYEIYDNIYPKNIRIEI